MKFLYYPGCSQKATARGYEESLLAICPELGIELEELPDWNCCGTTTTLSVNKVLALSLAARNLALAEGQDLDLVTPCPSCFLSMAKVNEVLAAGDDLATKVHEALAAGGYSYKGTVKIRHLLEVLVSEVGIELIKERTSKPLAGLKVAPYYGCQVVRPYSLAGDEPDDPESMEKIIEATGATVAPFAQRTACCGGTLVATRPSVGQAMGAEILKGIAYAEADLVVTPCNLCQVTMENYMRKSRKLLGDKLRLPIVTVTQLIGMAMGKEFKALGINRAMAPKACLRQINERIAAGGQAAAV
ncbi:MAG: CoB--CoM heterodisulfide reductase iron-sulfur subunit B family protein [Deltaproteobacteria bacterium]|nr:CoB--CoM heterodisulfide reductase iron-sulfur subunit B family protein [Deltaproteobacteria bacterium]